jgi:putative DNA methylase
MPQFIETQFPIARLSAESYKERKANNGQTLTRLGKWWGRKPLILVRATIIGMLMPASNDPKKDREIFLKILTMDDEGAWQRCKGDIPVGAWKDAASPEIQEEFFTTRGFQRGLSDEEKEEVCAKIWESLDSDGRKSLDKLRRRSVPTRKEFDALPYAERLIECERPESVEGPSPDTWGEINATLTRLQLASKA